MNAPRKIVTGLFYTLGSTYVGRLFGLVATLWLLPRLIDPATWGGVTLGVSIYLVLIGFKELGLASALLHYQERLEELAPMHFLFNLLVSALCIILILLCSYLIQSGVLQLSAFSFFGRQAGDAHDHWIVAWTLFVLAIFHLLHSASITSQTRLRSRLEFKSLALIHMFGILFSLGTAVWLAGNGFGTWALIIGGTSAYVVHAPVYVLFTVAWIWMRQPQEIRGLQWNQAHANLLWRYGKWFWGGWVFSTIIVEYPRIVAGTYLGWDELGYYTLAFLWAQLPTGAITHVLIGLTNPVYARYQADRERLSLVFGKMLRLIARTTALLGVFFFLEAERLIPLVSGAEWQPSVELLRWLVVYALCRPFLDDIQVLLLAVGSPRTFAKINGITMGVALVGIPLLVWQWGLQGVAIGVGLTAVLGAALSFYWVGHYVDMEWGPAFLRPLVSMGAAVAAIMLLDGLIPATGWLSLALRLGVETVVYLGVLLLLEGRELHREVRDLQRILSSKEAGGG